VVGLGALGCTCCNTHRILPRLYPLLVSFRQIHPLDRILISLSRCLTARRRRKAGRQPFYGTGWAARPGQGGQNAQPYYNNQHNQAAPPYSAPPYSAQPQQTPYGGANQGYYGQQQGVELQQPQPTYGRGGDDVYAPPSGPPPGKGGDGIIR
jgi:hypothetical protein